MGYSSYLDKDSIDILLEYQNIFSKKTLLEQQPQEQIATTTSTNTSEYGLEKGSIPDWAMRQLDWITSAPDNWLSLNPVDWMRWAGLAFSIVDPTGITSYPQLAKAWTEYNNVKANPKASESTKWYYTFWLLVAAFNAAPNIWLLFGGLPGLAKMGITGATRTMKAGPKTIEKAIEILRMVRESPQFEKVVFDNIEKYTTNLNNPKNIRDCLLEVKRILQDDKTYEQARKMGAELVLDTKGKLVSSDQLEELFKLWKKQKSELGSTGLPYSQALKQITKVPKDVQATQKAASAGVATKVAQAAGRATTGTLKWGLKSIVGKGSSPYLTSPAQMATRMFTGTGEKAKEYAAPSPAQRLPNTAQDAVKTLQSFIPQ